MPDKRENSTVDECQIRERSQKKEELEKIPAKTLIYCHHLRINIALEWCSLAEINSGHSI